MKRQVTFAEFVFLCAEDKGLVREFDRLTGSNLSMIGTGLDLMIDRATGRTAEGLEQFIAFVHEFVWLPITGDAQRMKLTGPACAEALSGAEEARS